MRRTSVPVSPMNAELRAQWNQIRESWPERAFADLERGKRMHGEAVRSNPGQYRDDVNRFMKAVVESHARLTRIKPHVEAGRVDRRRYDALVRQYEILGAGLFSGAYEAEQPAIAGPPVLIILGGIGFIAVAIIWAVVAWQQARVLDHQTKVMEAELVARVEMNRNGMTLQPSTLEFPPAPSPLVGPGGMSTGAKVGLGVALLATVGGLGYALYASKG